MTENQRKVHLDERPDFTKNRSEADCAAVMNLLREQLYDGSSKFARNRRKRKQFAVIDFLLVLLPKIGLILLAILIGAASAGAYAHYLVKPMYSATAKLCVLNREAEKLKWSDFQSGFLWIADCKEVFENWEISEAVRAKLNLTDSYETMRDRLTVYNPPETQILCVTYTCESPEAASEIANAYVQAGKAFIGEKMGNHFPSEISLAVIPSEPVGRGTGFYLVMGGLWGAVFAVAISFFRFTLDDHPKTPEDIKNVAGIPTLTIIPAQSNKTIRNNRKSR